MTLSSVKKFGNIFDLSKKLFWRQTVSQFWWNIWQIVSNANNSMKNMNSLSNSSLFCLSNYFRLAIHYLMKTQSSKTSNCKKICYSFLLKIKSLMQSCLWLVSLLQDGPKGLPCISWRFFILCFRVLKQIKSCNLRSLRKKHWNKQTPLRNKGNRDMHF